MKKLVCVLGLSLSSLAFAHNCPNDMKAIDAALTSTKVTGADLDKVKSLRSAGEKAHKEGKHDESMAALGQAKKYWACDIYCFCNTSHPTVAFFIRITLG